MTLVAGAYYLYTDGGVVGRNPSPDAGTWAWCLVGPDGSRVAEGAGMLVPPGRQPYREGILRQRGVIAWPGTPRHPATVTNNHSEWVAAAMGIEYIAQLLLADPPLVFTGYVAADSSVTLKRLFAPQATISPNELPVEWFVRTHKAMGAIRAAGGWLQPYHVKGHPTRQAKRLGHDAKGRPVSLHNVHVDAMCTEQATSYRLLSTSPIIRQLAGVT